MQEIIIRWLSLTGNCMQSEESELRFSISLYEIFANLDFRFDENFCNSIEEYDPQTNKWREAGKMNIE